MQSYLCVYHYFCAAHDVDLPKKTCWLLKAPNYGSVHANGNTIGAVTHYKCVSGYFLVGNPSRKCLSNGKWEGEAPVCRRKLRYWSTSNKINVWTQIIETSSLICSAVDCGPLVKPDYGYVKYDSTYYGSKAYYSCQPGYKLISSSSFRICQANRSWSDHAPICRHA